MNVHFTALGWEDYIHWLRRDANTLWRINALIEDARRHPFLGLGKPEALNGDRADWWSRRITGEHRFVYRVTGRRGVDQRVEIVACRYHYRR